VHRAFSSAVFFFSFRNVGYMKYDVTLFIEWMDFSSEISVGNPVKTFGGSDLWLWISQITLQFLR
jgi:hypothetical protein